MNRGPQKDVKRKTCTSLAKRTFVLSEKEACGKTIPAPDKYNPKYPKSMQEKYTYTNLNAKKDPDEQSFKTYIISRKRHLEAEKTEIERKKENTSRVKEYVAGKQEKTKYDPKELQYPLNPSLLDQFDITALKLKKNPINKGRGPKGKGFGMELKFPLETEEKWKKKVKTYNAAVDPDKALDPKKDKQPGPAGYSMICNWPEAKKKAKDDGKKRNNYMKHISTGPKISNYYSHSTLG